MPLKYDNLADARQKLQKTYALYKDRAIFIKTVEEASDTDGKMRLVVFAKQLSSGRNMEFYIDDEEFNCTRYNIGYMNPPNKSLSTPWFYRMPYRQYAQGLKVDQLSANVADNFLEVPIIEKAHKYFGDMLENKYPTLEECKSAVMTQQVMIAAFHRNFAVSFERGHEDFLVHYKGRIIGFTKDFNTIKLKEHENHLWESLQEALNAKAAR